MQNLEPRFCYAKHKIGGGLIPLMTEDVYPAQELMGVAMEEYQEIMAIVPLGFRYLICPARFNG
ncbi:MAG: hypothetical protein HY787_03570 [Deltaproteobacteria bacterium]|nr:hypothetical protein [Deltaproteobacteria bacterium]